MSRGKGRKTAGIYCAGVLLILLCSIITVPASHLWAGENYGTHAARGAEDIMAGMLPPGGTKIFIDYFTLYTARNLKDNGGRNQAIPGVGKVDFKTDVVANSFRYVDVTKFRVLGGDFVWHVIVPVVYQHTAMSAGPADMGSQSKTGLGDIEAGAGVSWHLTPTFHMLGALDVVAPTGSYDKSDLVNIGRNYWSFEPLWEVTYLGGKDSPIPGFEVSAKMMYFINTINTATSYTSGQEFTADYFVGQHLGKWVLGATGNYYYQTTPDKQYGRTAVDPFSGLRTGVQGKSLTLGPGIQYNFSDKACVTAKYLFPVSEQNMPQGNAFWLKFIWPL